MQCISSTSTYLLGALLNCGSFYLFIFWVFREQRRILSWLWRLTTLIPMLGIGCPGCTWSTMSLELIKPCMSILSLSLYFEFFSLIFFFSKWHKNNVIFALSLFFSLKQRGCVIGGSCRNGWCWCTVCVGLSFKSWGEGLGVLHVVTTLL